MDDYENPPLPRFINCTSCNTKKHELDFQRGQTYDGLRYWCRACVAAYGKERAEKFKSQNAARELGLIEDTRPPTKRCSKCRVVSGDPPRDFHICRATKDGLQRVCRACMKALNAEAYQRNLKRHELGAPARSRKTCSRCKSRKPVCEFTKDAGRADGLCQYCRACERDRRSEASLGRSRGIPEAVCNDT